MLNFFQSKLRVFVRTALVFIALSVGSIVAVLLALTLSRAQQTMANTDQPPLPNEAEAGITITLAAANTPTQTTYLSITNPTTNTIAVSAIFYRGSAANGQVACTLGPDLLAGGITNIYTVSETPGCSNQIFIGDVVVSANPTATASTTIQRITISYVAPNADCGSAGPCYASPQAAADVAETGDTIKVAQGVYTSQAFQVLYLNRGVTIMGGYTKTNWGTAYPISQPVVLDGQNNLGQRVVQVVSTGAGALTLDGLVIRNGNFSNEPNVSNAGGAGINVVSGTVIIRNSQIMSNVAAAGAGIDSLGSLVISGTQFIGNEGNVGGLGAAIRIQNHTLAITNSQFINNRFLTGTRTIPLQRGAIDAKDAGVTLISSTIENTLGGGIFAQNGSLTISNSQIRHNTSAGITLLNGDVQLLSNTIEFNGNNVVEGGGISFDSLCVGSLYLANNIIRNNAALQGGGLGGRLGPVTLVNNLFQDNRAVTSGGAMSLHKDGFLTCIIPPTGNLQSNRLLGNRADKAGAIFVDVDYRAQMTNDIVANNVTSGFQTAAIHVATGRLEVLHATLVSNGRYAVSSGNGTVALTNTIIARHSVAGLAGSNASSRNGLFFANGGNCSSGATCTNDRSGDPRFYWAQVNNFHICQDSAALGQGINASVFTDFEGERRPQGTGPDIGADEWNEKPCDPVRGVFLPILFRP